MTWLGFVKLLDFPWDFSPFLSLGHLARRGLCYSSLIFWGKVGRLMQYREDSCSLGDKWWIHSCILRLILKNKRWFISVLKCKPYLINLNSIYLLWKFPNFEPIPLDISQDIYILYIDEIKIPLKYGGLISTPCTT